MGKKGRVGRDEKKERKGGREGRGPRMYLLIFLRITYEKYSVQKACREAPRTLQKAQNKHVLNIFLF